MMYYLITICNLEPIESVRVSAHTSLSNACRSGREYLFAFNGNEHVHVYVLKASSIPLSAWGSDKELIDDPMIVSVRKLTINGPKLVTEILKGGKDDE